MDRFNSRLDTAEGKISKLKNRLHRICPDFSRDVTQKGNMEKGITYGRPNKKV
jgi:hypothetical protein